MQGRRAGDDPIPAGLRAHPYRSAFVRAAATALLRTFFVVALAERALLGVLVAEALLSYRTSQNVGVRAAVGDRLKHFDLLWACGCVAGVACGVFLTHLLYHPYDTVWYDPSTWSDWQTVTGAVRLVGHAVEWFWHLADPLFEPASFARLLLRL